jgi:excisionase family DNA binding protein
MLKTEEAAKKLNLTKSTLEAWRCRGGGPAFIKLGRAVRYRQEDLDAFLARNRRTNTSRG